MSHDPKSPRSSDYHAARAVEERRLAMASADPKVRAIHLEMAEKYDELAKGEDVEQRDIMGGQQRA